MTDTSLLVPPGGQTVAVIIAHPDDAESFCGGTIARLAQEGRAVHYLIVTHGEKGSDDPQMTPERLRLLREQEQRAAAQTLGVQTVTFLEGYVDGTVTASLPLREALVRFLRTLRPEVVLTFDPWKRYELHPDHRAVGLCTVDAIAAARGRLDYPEQVAAGLTPHTVRQIYFFNTDQPNHWVDISAVFERKVAARCCHISQLRPGRHPGDYLRRWAEEAGAMAGMRLAEAFHVMSL
jgi:LmbE family N-acetylglucosaminyl deacetylase